jgi:hypothetical protein
LRCDESEALFTELTEELRFRAPENMVLRRIIGLKIYKINA